MRHKCFKFQKITTFTKIITHQTTKLYLKSINSLKSYLSQHLKTSFTKIYNIHTSIFKVYQKLQKHANYLLGIYKIYIYTKKSWENDFSFMTSLILRSLILSFFTLHIEYYIEQMVIYSSVYVQAKIILCAENIYANAYFSRLEKYKQNCIFDELIKCRLKIMNEFKINSD